MIKDAVEKYKSIRYQVKASFWFLVCTVMQRGISIVTTPIFSRLLSPGEYGQYGVFNSWLDIVTVFVTFRIYYGVFVQGLVKNESDRKRYTSSIQGLLFVLCIFWTIIYILFRSFWNALLGLTTVQMLAMLVMIWSVGAYRLWAAEQRNQYKYKALVLTTLLVNVLKPVVGVLLVINSEDKVTARILGIALVELVCFSWTFFYHMLRGKQFYSGKYWRHALLFNIPLIPHYLSQTVLNSADRIMIMKMVGDSEAGMYSLAYSLAKLMTMISTALNQTLTPWMYQKIKANKAKEIERTTYPAMICVGFMNIIMIAFAPEIMRLFAPESYHNAIWVIPPVSLSVFLMFSYQLYATFEFYFEKTKYIMAASLIGAVLNIILNYVFIRLFGYLAAGYTTLVCYLIYCFMHYFFMKKIIRNNMMDSTIYEAKKVFSILGVFLLIGFVFLASYKNDICRFILIFVLLGIIAYKRNIIGKYIKELIYIRKKKNV